MSPISEKKQKARKRGLYFFSIVFCIILFMQITNYFNGKHFEWLPVIASIFALLVCNYYFIAENYAKERGWL
jgi:lipoprotein signal peptidase